MLRRVSPEVVAVQFAVRLVERLGRVVHGLRRDGTFRHRDAHLECLTEVAQIRSTRVLALRLVETLFGKRNLGFAGQRVELALQVFSFNRS